MDSMDNLRERVEALEQRTEHVHQHTRPHARRRRWWRRTGRVAALIACGLVLAQPAQGQAKTFQCGAGDVPCLIDAIQDANANGEPKNTIRLEAGTYRVPGNPTTALPTITSTLAITGAGATATSLEDGHLDVAPTGSLRLHGLTLTQSDEGVGILGGIDNAGTLIVSHSTISHNRGVVGGGIANRNTGTLIVSNSTISHNQGDLEGGGIANRGGAVNLTHSTLAHNHADFVGGGLSNMGGTVIMTSTTFTGNGAGQGGGGLVNVGGFTSITNSTFESNNGQSVGGIGNTGTMVITNSTVARNHGENVEAGSVGGLGNAGGTVIMQNTILALNTATGDPRFAFFPDCSGVVTSHVANLVGDPTGCTLTPQASLTGDPGLDAFTDDGTPGHGHFPLLPTSQAIDAGNDAVCPKRDQLGQRRVHIHGVGTSRCDIGAIEFHERAARPPDEADDPHHEADPAPTAPASQ